jgi:hypothetical protein
MRLKTPYPIFSSVHPYMIKHTSKQMRHLKTVIFSLAQKVQGGNVRRTLLATGSTNPRNQFYFTDTSHPSSPAQTQSTYPDSYCV